jgi:hypothetical protein
VVGASPLTSVIMRHTHPSEWQRVHGEPAPNDGYRAAGRCVRTTQPPASFWACDDQRLAQTRTFICVLSVNPTRFLHRALLTIEY